MLMAVLSSSDLAKPVEVQHWRCHILLAADRCMVVTFCAPVEAPVVPRNFLRSLEGATQAAQIFISWHISRLQEDTKSPGSS